MAADPLDVLTLAEAKTYLSGLTSTSADAKVAALVTAVSRRLDVLCGPLVTRTVTETHNGGVSVIWLRQAPAAVSSVVDGATTLTTSDYAVDGDGAAVYRTPSQWRRGMFSAGFGNVVVTYVAGRFADTASVDPTVKAAAGLFLQHLWRPSEGGGSETYGAPGVTATGVPSFGIPNVVRDLLTPYLRPPAVA